MCVCVFFMQVEQIIAEYKVRALEHHPDKHPGNQKAGKFIFQIS